MFEELDLKIGEAIKEAGSPATTIGTTCGCCITTKCTSHNVGCTETCTAGRPA